MKDSCDRDMANVIEFILSKFWTLYMMLYAPYYLTMMRFAWLSNEGISWDM